MNRGTSPNKRLNRKRISVFPRIGREGSGITVEKLIVIYYSKEFHLYGNKGGCLKSLLKSQSLTKGLKAKTSDIQLFAYSE